MKIFIIAIFVISSMLLTAQDLYPPCTPSPCGDSIPWSTQEYIKTFPIPPAEWIMYCYNVL